MVAFVVANPLGIITCALRKEKVMEAKKQLNSELFGEQTALAKEPSCHHSFACHPDANPLSEWIDWPASE